MSVIGKHGVTTTTPQNVLLGAGTFMKNLKCEGGKWTGDVIGATSGGGKISIVGEFYDIPVDGALVKVKGMTVKNGGTVTCEANFVEMSTDVMKMATLFEEGTDSTATGFTMLKDKKAIAEGDYVTNFGFVGFTANDAKQIVFVMENALCTSGMEIEAKNKEAAVIKLTMECYANNEGNLDTLPVKIYYPNAATTTTTTE